MFEAVSFDGEKPLINMQEYLRKHEIVYKTPAYKGYEGLPIGNGDLGGIVYNTKQESVIVINKCDALDCRDKGRFGAWAWEEEERNTALVSCATIRITDEQPSFDTLYLEDFEARLKIGEGRIEIKSSTPFSNCQEEVYVSTKYECMVVDVKASSLEPVKRNISIERWGSRNFFHYYEQYRADPSLKTGGTVTEYRDNCIFIKQKLRGNNLVVCARLVGDKHSINVKNSHLVQFTTEKKCDTSFKIIINVMCGQDMNNILDLAIKKVNKCADNIEDVRKCHNEEWRCFWEKSFIHIKDDYLENLYYLYLYQMNSSSRGKLPTLFSGSLWIWNHDIRNWGHLYHWNQQQQYWGLHAANHSELVENYLEFRYSMLDIAKKDSMDIAGCQGAFFSDICSLTGFQAWEPDTTKNFTVGSQIALDFYKHYLYTGDKDFLREKAYPFMKECITLYLNILKEENERYHLNGAAVYESYWNVKDTLTDYVAIKTLFKSTCEVAKILDEDKEEVEKWVTILDKIYDIPLLKTQDDIEIFSYGIKWDKKPIEFSEGNYPYSPFTGSILCPIYPAGLIGLNKMDTKLFKVAKNTTRLFLDNNVYGNEIDWSGHTPLLEVAARLGMTKDLKKLFDIYIEKFQCFPNGFMHYADMKTVCNDSRKTYLSLKLRGDEVSTDWEKVHEKSYGDRISYPMCHFLHHYNETGGNINAAINEMLLQSHDGIIRVFPTVSEEDDAMFSLCAVGNFIVTSEKKEGQILYMAIKSNLGGLCRIYNPWDCDIDLIINNKLKDEKEFIDNSLDVIEINTKAGDMVILQRKEFPLNIYYKTYINSYINMTVKRKGTSVLGKERMF